jgi:hypothetical protein
VSRLAATHQYTLSPETRKAVLAFFVTVERGEGFGNGRVARKVFQEMTERHARRIADRMDAEVTADDLSRLIPADLPEPGTIG